MWIQIWDYIRKPEVIISIIGAWFGTFGWIFAFLRERKLKEYERKMNEKSEVFKTKLDVFRNFVKEEFLFSTEQSKEEKKTLEYYWEIWLFWEINTLKSLINSKGNDSDTAPEDIKKISNVINSMRIELNWSNIKGQEDIIDDYSRLLLQLSGKASEKQKQEIDISTSSEYKFRSLWELMDIHSGLFIEKQYIQPGWEKDPIYLRIRDIQAFNQANGERISRTNLPENIAKKEITASNIFVISSVGTIWKTCYLNDGKKMLISSSLNFWKLRTAIVSGDYLSIVFRTLFIFDQLRTITRGIAQQFVSIQWLKDVRIPILTKIEQDKLTDGLSNENIDEKAKQLDWMLFSKKPR